MRYTLFLFFLIFASCTTEKHESNTSQFSIQGELSQYFDSTFVFIEKRGNSMHPDQPRDILDSAIIQDGKFTLNGAVKEPNYYSIVIDSCRGWKPFLLENKNYTLRGEQSQIWKSKITSPNNNTLIESEMLSRALNPLIYEMNDAVDSSFFHRRIGNHEKASFFNAMYQKLNKRYGLTIEKFIEDYPNSYISLLKFKAFESNSSLNRRKELYNLLNDRLKNHSVGKEILSSFTDTLELILVGNEFPDLSFTRPDQNNFKLEDVQKKYTLLEFWASWCAPCREGFPAMKSTYALNKNQLEIIAVSIDNKPANWKKAITEDELPWINIIDSEQKEKFQEKFKIKSIPYNILINEEGMIEAINIKMDELNSKLN